MPRSRTQLLVSAFATFLEHALIPRRANRNLMIRDSARERLILAKFAAARMIQSNFRGHSAKLQLSAAKRAASVLQAWARGRAAIAEAEKRRHALITLQRWQRRRKLRRAGAALANNRTWGKLAGTRATALWTVFFAVVLAMFMVSMAVSSSPCLRGNTLQPGDPVLARGQCIEGKGGSRFFGWLPGVAWKPRLGVSGNGEMYTTRSDGKRVVLGGGEDSGTGGNVGIFCKMEMLVQRVTSRGDRSAHGQLVLGKGHFCSAPHWEKWLRRGGVIYFTRKGEVEVTNAAGKVVWSLTQHLDDEDRRKGGLRLFSRGKG